MKKGIFGTFAVIVAWAGISLADELPPAFPVLGVPKAPAQPATPPPAPATMESAGAAPALPASGGACGSSSCFPSCGLDGCCNNNSCCNQIYVSGEYLMWWIKQGPLPVELITTGPFSAALPGAFGQPGTQSLIPGTINYGGFSGMRYSAGYWFDPIFGVELGGFMLEQRTTSFNAQSGGNEVIAIPTMNAATGAPSRFTIAESDLRSGSVALVSSSQLWGAELNGLVNLYRDGNFRLTGIYGFRYMQLDESISIIQNSKALTNGLGDDNIIFNGTEFGPFANASPNAANMVVDTFRTRNYFYGAQLGLRGDWLLDNNWFVGGGFKVGIGDTHQEIANSGSTFGYNLPAGTPNNPYPYGRLVGPSNSGTFSRDMFGVVPEVEVKLGYQFNQYVKAFVGYNFLYWSNVVRPGDQINQTVDYRGSSSADSPPNHFIPGFTGTTAPTVPFHGTDFWAQGINLGLVFTY